MHSISAWSLGIASVPIAQKSKTNNDRIASIAHSIIETIRSICFNACTKMCDEIFTYVSSILITRQCNRASRKIIWVWVTISQNVHQSNKCSLSCTFERPDRFVVKWYGYYIIGSSQTKWSVRYSKCPRNLHTRMHCFQPERIFNIYE